MTDLLPCPFCGSDIVGPLEFSQKQINGEMVDIPFSPHVHCGVCGVSGPVASNDKYAIEAWNTREQPHDR